VQEQNHQAAALPTSNYNNTNRDSINARQPAAPYIGNNTSIDTNRNAAAAATPAAGQLVDCETTTGCLKVNPDAAQHWIYPLGVPEREYQLSAISTALLQNTLVCLPTGLGKTLIAAVVMHNFSRWFPEGKVVFVAPTKPLVSQQIEACRQFMGLSPQATAELTGRIKAEERKALWQDSERRVFFCTPQTFFNDVKLGVCPYDAVSCIVIDECHRCIGQSEIAQTLRLMRQKYKLKFRVLGLSATPGSSAEQVQEVLTNLGATGVHFRNEEDPDVSPYVYKKNTELIVVEPESEQSNPRTILLAVLQRLVGQLAGARFYFGPVNAERVTRINLVHAQNSAKEAAAAGSGGVPSVQAQDWFRQATVLTDIRDSLDKYGILPTAALVRTKLNEERCIKALHTKESTFAHFVTKLESSAAAGGSGPRLAHLVELLRKHFEGDGSPGGVIVFASLREGVQSIVDALKQHEPLIRARSFVGQGSGCTGGGSGGWGNGKSTSGGRSKSGGGSKSGPGMNQKEQKDAIKGFSNGQYNVLVATCIGEEGLDIPAVDLIICYDATASPTRAVQRRGRTGRHREGRVVYLLGAGREEEHYHRIKENTAQLHNQLRQAERYFELVLPGPRMLPRQYNPEKIVVDSGFSDYNRVCVLDDDGIEVLHGGAVGKIRSGEAAKGRGRGRGGTRAGGGGNGASNTGRRGTTVHPSGAVLAMLEAGAIRLAEEGPRYPQAPPSPIPSQPCVTQFESPAGPHQLLFPDSSSAFIRAGSNGRRLAIAPPPSVEVLFSATIAGTEGSDDEGRGGGAAEQTKVPTPQLPRRLRFLPEIGDENVITLPCGRILEQQEQQQPAWAFLVAAICRPPQPHPTAAAAVNALGAGASKTRRPTKGRKAPAVAALVHRPTPPAAVLNLAHGAEDAVGKKVEPLVAALTDLPVELNNDIDTNQQAMEIDLAPAEVAEEQEPGIIDLVYSTEEEQPAAAADGGGGGGSGQYKNDNEEDTYLFEDYDFIESSSQPVPRKNDHIASVPASTAATAGITIKVPEQEEQEEEEEEEYIPLAKRMRMLREQSSGNGARTTAAPPSAAPLVVARTEGTASAPAREPSRPSVPPSIQQILPPSITASDAPIHKEGSLNLNSGARTTTTAAAACNVEEVNNFDDDNFGGHYFCDDYNNGGYEEDELWEEWQDEEGMAAAAQVEREREEKEVREREQQQGLALGNGPRRRNIITSQSPGFTQPLAIAAIYQEPTGSDHCSLPSSMGQEQQQQQRWQGGEQNRGLTRLRKAGNAAGDREGLEEDTNKNEEKGLRRATKLQHRRRQRANGPYWAGRFLDTEAQLSGDDSDGNEDGNLDGYESDFIDDHPQSNGNGGGRSQEEGSFATPRDHASLAAFHHRRLMEERNSPSPGSLLRRLQHAKLGRLGGVDISTPRTFGHAGGLSAPPYSNDDYDREDSFIDDGKSEEEGGFDTPGGRGSHADNCCGVCGGVGELLLCDACPATFHLSCVGLESCPIGDWFCPVCVDSNISHRVGDDGHSGGGEGVAKPTAAAAAAVGGGHKKSKVNKPTNPKQPDPCLRPPAAAARPKAVGDPVQPGMPAVGNKTNNNRSNKRPLLATDSDDDFA
jgi:Fanconi anemia group M protein